MRKAIYKADGQGQCTKQFIKQLAMCNVQNIATYRLSHCDCPNVLRLSYFSANRQNKISFQSLNPNMGDFMGDFIWHIKLNGTLRIQKIQMETVFDKIKNTTLGIDLTLPHKTGSLGRGEIDSQSGIRNPIPERSEGIG